MITRRPQFSLRALLVLVLAAACFFGGIHFERERRRREVEAARAEKMIQLMIYLDVLLSEDRYGESERKTLLRTAKEIEDSEPPWR